jgi:hypothetical protein
MMFFRKDKGFETGSISLSYSRTWAMLLIGFAGYQRSVAIAMMSTAVAVAISTR